MDDHGDDRTTDARNEMTGSASHAPHRSGVALAAACIAAGGVSAGFCVLFTLDEYQVLSPRRMQDFALAMLGLSYCFGTLALMFGLVGTITRLSGRWTGARGTYLMAGILLGGIGVVCGAQYFPRHSRLADERHALNCCQNLTAVGKAMMAYANAYDYYWPYDERGPLYSLTLLYPDWIKDSQLFVCPGVRRERRVFPPGCSLAGKSCSYGYDNEHSLKSIKPNTAMMSDLPGNHGNGYNVLDWDSHVAFSDTPYASSDPTDNIFAREPGWGADTDACIRQ